MTTRDPRTGRYVSTANTPESGEGTFPTYTEMPVEVEGADPAELAYDSVPRRGPAADELAQLDARSPLRARNPVMVHPDDEGHHNAVMRTAARNAGPMDSSPFLTGLTGLTAPSTGIQGSRVEVHGDHNPLSPVRSQDIAPGRPPGRVRTVTDDPADNAEEIQRRMDEGLFSFDASNALRPTSRGRGRDRWR